MSSSHFLDRAHLKFALDERTLLEQANGMERSHAMKYIVGPVLTSLLEPMYSPNFNKSEKDILQARDDKNVAERLVDVLFERFSTAYGDVYEYTDQRPERMQQLDKLVSERRLVIIPYDMYVDSLQSGIAGPIRVAAAIHEAETGAAKATMYYSGPHKTFRLDDFIDAYPAIMQRTNFPHILRHFTKGPTGFLGRGSERVSDKHFLPTTVFEFDGTYRSRLGADEAFVLDETGSVERLSDLYYTVANRKRTDIKRDAEKIRRDVESQSPDSVFHDPSDSSGCPVRHSFVDSDNVPHDPLTLVARDFTVSAITTALAVRK